MRTAAFQRNMRQAGIPSLYRGYGRQNMMSYDGYGACSGCGLGQENGEVPFDPNAPTEEEIAAMMAELPPHIIADPKKGVLLYLQSAVALDRGTAEAIKLAVQQALEHHDVMGVERIDIVQQEGVYYVEALFWGDIDEDMLQGGINEFEIAEGIQGFVRLATEEDRKVETPKWLIYGGIGAGVVALGLVGLVIWRPWKK